MVGIGCSVPVKRSDLLPAGKQLSCSVQLYNAGNVGLINATIFDPANVTDCTKPVLEPGDGAWCSVTFTAGPEDFEAGNMTLKVGAQSLNRVDNASVVSGQVEQPLQLTQTRQVAVAATVQPNTVSAAGKALQ
jgi:hypothetical protein